MGPVGRLEDLYWSPLVSPGQPLPRKRAGTHGPGASVQGREVGEGVFRRALTRLKTGGGRAAAFTRSMDAGRIAWGDALEGVTATSGSWEAWLYFDDLTSQRVFGYTTTWAAEGQWMLFVEATGRLAFALSANGEPRTVADIASRTWHHVAATWNGTELVLYLDGVAVDSTPAAAMSLDSSEAVGVSNSSDTLGFNGAVDELAVYDYALSAEQVEMHFLAAQPDEGGDDTGPDGDDGGGDATDGAGSDDESDKGCTTAPGPLGASLAVMASLLAVGRRR